MTGNMFCSAFVFAVETPSVMLMAAIRNIPIVYLLSYKSLFLSCCLDVGSNLVS